MFANPEIGSGCECPPHLRALPFFNCNVHQGVDHNRNTIALAVIFNVPQMHLSCPLRIYEKKKQHSRPNLLPHIKSSRTNRTIFHHPKSPSKARIRNNSSSRSIKTAAATETHKNRVIAWARTSACDTRPRKTHTHPKKTRSRIHNIHKHFKRLASGVVFMCLTQTI